MLHKVFTCFPRTRLWYKLWIMWPHDVGRYKYFGKSFSNLIFWALPNLMTSSLTVTPYTHATSNSGALGSLMAMPFSPFFAFLTPSHILVLGIWGKRQCNLMLKSTVSWARMSGVQSRLHYFPNVWSLCIFWIGVITIIIHRVVVLNELICIIYLKMS